jgi:hypothetical protein
VRAPSPTCDLHKILRTPDMGVSHRHAVLKPQSCVVRAEISAYVKSGLFLALRHRAQALHNGDLVRRYLHP